MTDPILLLLVLLALAMGLVLGYVLGQSRARSSGQQASDLAAQEARDLALAQIDQARRLAAAEAVAPLQIQLAQAQERLLALEESKKQLGEQFENLANRIFEEKSTKFVHQNKEGLNELLGPLKTQLHDFKAKVEQVYETEGKERSALQEQVRQLMQLNHQISEEAHNLTSALKGNVKTQGNFGELILESVLESAGLRKGIEFETQESHTAEDGRRYQPDVLLRMPEGRVLIIDSKVTLTAYEAYASAVSPDEQATALKAHLASVRAHMKGLSEKNYQTVVGEATLDFVLMFVAVEPAFMLAVTHDRDLFQEAWKKNVLLVSPSTLLFVVRTLAHLWRQEQQSRNAQEIASQAAGLYDKFVGFIEDMNAIGKKLQEAEKEHGLAMTKLTGKGGLTRRAEKIKALGVAPTKSLPAAFVGDEGDAADD